MDYFCEWQGAGRERFNESAEIEISQSRLSARGTQLGARPIQYRLDYELTTSDAFVVLHLSARTQGNGWSRRLELSRTPDGQWHAEVGGAGEEEALGHPAAEVSSLSGAVDCDLGRSPVTNSLAIMRLGLHREPGTAELLAAWVDVPSLSVRSIRQRYTHVSQTPGCGVVLYQSLESDYQASLEVDRAGLVRRHPGHAVRTDI